MALKTSIKQLLSELYATPEKAIEKVNLVYVNDVDLSISRTKVGKKFIYKRNNEPLKKADELKRIEQLVIPPAWRSVRISDKSNGHLQAIGRDLKNRKQYRYHALWSKIRNQTKFYRMLSFGRQLPLIREKLDTDLELQTWTRRKVLALVIRLMEETHIRIGSEQYARRNKTYGLTTLRSRHIALENDRLKFKFVGKKGKKHEISLKNKKLIRLVNRCEEIPGWELFKFYDKNGVKHRIESSMVNEYLSSLCNDSFTAKDFRTWSGTIIFFDTLLDLGYTESNKKKEKNLIKAFDETAKNLGNTRTVCKKYYVHPAVTEAYETGVIEKYFLEVKNNSSIEKRMSHSEVALIHLLEDYQPSFLDEVF